MLIVLILLGIILYLVIGIGLVRLLESLGLDLFDSTYDNNRGPMVGAALLWPLIVVVLVCMSLGYPVYLAVVWNGKGKKDWARHTEKFQTWRAKHSTKNIEKDLERTVNDL